MTARILRLRWLAGGKRDVSMSKMSIIMVLLFVSMKASGDVTLAELFSDHMVLQRNRPVSIYGKADPGENVTVTFSSQKKSMIADQDGIWGVKLDAMMASTNSATLCVAGKNQVTIDDVVVGDVWVCSGQSNMEFLQEWTGRKDDIKGADYPLMRQLYVPLVKARAPHTDGTIKGNKWIACTPETVGKFTAVGFYFGRKLTQETGIPIGLIKSAWGGTAIESWIPYVGLAAVPELSKEKLNLDKQIKDYVEALAEAELSIGVYVAKARQAIGNNGAMPEPPELKPYPIGAGGGWGCIYNGMIHPLVSFTIKGVIWYQGEANGGDGDIYYQKMRALVGGWRQAWNQGVFPFYYVQLANYQNPNSNPQGGDGWARVRMAQSKSLSITNTGMAVAIDLADVGNPSDIHPKNKRDVGERLALWALAKDYPSTTLRAGGKAADLVYSGPLYREMKIEGNKIRLVFDSVGSGLVVATKKGYDPAVKDPQGKLQKFAIAGADKKWVWADAVIDGQNVVVSSPEVSKPVAVRYAFSMNPVGCNLYNNEGLPAAPFRTDDW